MQTIGWPTFGALVLVVGREGKRWEGLLFDVPRYCPYLSPAGGIWVRPADLESARSPTPEEMAEVDRQALVISLTGQLPRLD